MRSLRWISRTIVCGILAALVLSGCAPASSRQDRDVEVPAKVARTVEVAGLKLEVPDDYLLWPARVPVDPREPKYGGVIKVPYPGDPPSIDPTLTSSYLRGYITSSVYERLVHWPASADADPYDIKLIPGLAESWKVSEDGLTYTFKLRKGVKWVNVPPLNGREFSAADVRFSYEYYTRKESIMKEGFANVSAVSTPDDFTAIYRLKEREPGFIFELSSTGIGYIVPMEVAEQDGNLKRVVLGTGPFYNDDGYQPKQGIKYKRSPNYWGKDDQGRQLPFVEGWEFVVVPDAAARQAGFRTGKLDWGSYGTIDQTQALLRTNPNIYGQETYSPRGGAGYMFRLDKTPWNDVRVRRAMNLAIDYNQWAQLVYSLSKASALAIEPRTTWFKDRNLSDAPEGLGEWFQHDPEKAKRLLAEAGYPNGFKTTLEYFKYAQSNEENVELLRDFWAKIGVEAELKSMDYTVFRANVDSAGWENISHAFSFPNRMDVDSQLNFLYSKGLGIKTQGGINDPKIDEWVLAFWASKDEGERIKLLRQIRERSLDQVFYIPNPITPGLQMIQPWVRNLTPNNNAFGAQDYRPIAYAWIDDGWRK